MFFCDMRPSFVWEPNWHTIFGGTVQVGQMIMPLPFDMPSRLLEARKALPHPAEQPRTRP
jgi:hypothetical protein